MKPTLYEMAAAVAIKIQQIDCRLEIRPCEVHVWEDLQMRRGEVIP